MSVEEGGDESLPAGLEAPTATPEKIVDLMAREADEGLMPVESATLTMATPEEVVDFVRHRLLAIEAPTGNVTIVAVTPSDAVTTAVRCEWEQCQEPAVVKVKWRREKYNGRDDAFDFANYCDAHVNAATANGAMVVK